MIKQGFFALLLLHSTMGSALAQGALAMFQPGSYQAILQQQQGQPFVLVLWSLECSHCMGELQMLGELLAERPQLRLVVVSTDTPADSGELSQVLAQHGLGAASSWVFAADDAARLRFEIDRTWYGELPRSYLFNAQHQRAAHSGVLKRDELERWAETNNGGV